VPVSCFVKLGWGAQLENLTAAAARFGSDYRLYPWMRGRDGQLILKAEGDWSEAARMVRAFQQEALRSHEIWRVVPILRTLCVVNPAASWFLFATERPSDPDESLSRCIAADELILWHVGTALGLEYDQTSRMYVWKGPDAVPLQPSSPGEQEPAADEPLFSPEGDPPDFIEIEES
jgi:hypothetical protein